MKPVCGGEKRPGSAAMKSCASKGMTLLELIYALALVTLFTGGILASLIQARRTSEGVVRHNIAIAIAQGYSEQMKNMEYTDLIMSPATEAEITANETAFTIKTRKDEATVDYLVLSAGTPVSLKGFDPATASCRATNIKSVPVNPANNALLNMEMRFWIWVNDPTASSPVPIKTVSIIYAFKVQDGVKSRWRTGAVKSMKSFVPTF